jgi:hypothetical protein
MNKLNKLRQRRREINAQIKSILDADKKIRSVKRKEADKLALRKVFAVYGGRKSFIRKWGMGEYRATPLRTGGCEFFYESALYSRECSILNVDPTTEQFRCSFNGKHEYDGLRLCKKHLNFVTEHPNLLDRLHRKKMSVV